MIEPCMRGVGAKAAAQSTAIAMDAIANPEILDCFTQVKCAAASVYLTYMYQYEYMYFLLPILTVL